jgi:hypothetical protein
MGLSTILLQPDGAEVRRAGGAYLNDLRKYTELKTAKDRFVVTPNNVTIDAYPAMDLTVEPVVIFVPPLSQPRRYLVQIGDSFDEIARNVGGGKGAQPGVYIVTGPDFAGAVPGEMTQVSFRTKFGVVAVRILANGSADLPKAVEAQTGFRLMPLSAYLRSGLAYKTPEPRGKMALYESEAPEDIRFFDELGDAMRKRLRASADSTDSLVASPSDRIERQWRVLVADARRTDEARACASGQDRTADDRQQMGGGR